MVTLKTVVEELATLVCGHASAFHVRTGATSWSMSKVRSASTNGVASAVRQINSSGVFGVSVSEGQIDEGLSTSGSPAQAADVQPKVSEVIFDGLVQMPAKRVRGGERPTCMPHRDEPVSVHEVHLHGAALLAQRPAGTVVEVVMTSASASMSFCAEIRASPWRVST